MMRAIRLSQRKSQVVDLMSHHSNPSARPLITQSSERQQVPIDLGIFEDFRQQEGLEPQRQVAEDDDDVVMEL